MDLYDARAYTRRTFMMRSLAMASAATTIPGFLDASAKALPMPGLGMSSIPGVDENRILLVVQLGGGNDGLNTVVPYGDDAYYRARRSIAVPQGQVGKLSGRGASGVGLHPAMDALREMYDDGMCAIVQGVGYPNPNRSHFKSMDIWHTGDTTGTGEGWLGRYFDSQCCGFGKGESGTAEATEPPPSPIAIGRDAPLALQGRQVQPVSFETADLFRWTGEGVDGALTEPYNEITRAGAPENGSANSNAAFLMRTALDAQVSSERIRAAVRREPDVQYPNSGLARQLAMVASMIRAGMETRVYYVTLGGFDTHAQQGSAQGQHANLLRQYAEAMRAFYRDLRAGEQDERVLTLTFSEFGRRVSQNASGGTDHGTAAPVFLLGPMVTAGVHGVHPSLTDLDSGDLKHQIDFRHVYATILEEWLSTDSEVVLGQRYRRLKALDV